MRWGLFFLLLLQCAYAIASNIYVISQEERPDKWERIQQLLSGEAVRFSAQNGNHFSQKKTKKLRQQFNVDLKASELGRFVTELAIIKEAYKKGLHWIQIIDDDCDEIRKIENSETDFYREGPSLFVSRKGMEKILKDPKQLCSIPGVFEKLGIGLRWRPEFASGILPAPKKALFENRVDAGGCKGWDAHEAENQFLNHERYIPEVSRFIKKGYLCRDETAVIKYLKQIPVTELDSGMKGVDCIYVINLDARKDKWERLIPIFEKLKLKVNRVSAINGWQLSKEDKKALAGPYHCRLKGGQLGCLLSHVSILKDAYERGFSQIWVLEDDVEFLEELSQISTLIETLSGIDPDWDIFYTDSDCKNEKGEYFRPLHTDPRPDQLLKPLDFYQERIVINQEIMQIRSRFATHSMLVSKKGIKKILDYFTHVYLFSPIDWDIHYIPEIRQYASSRDLVTKWRNNPYSDTVSTSSLNRKNNNRN